MFIIVLVEFYVIKVICTYNSSYSICKSCLENINLNHKHFAYSLSYAKHKYFYIFPRYSNSLADLLVLVYLIIEVRKKWKRIEFQKTLPIN